MGKKADKKDCNNNSKAISGKKQQQNRKEGMEKKRTLTNKVDSKLMKKKKKPILLVTERHQEEVEDEEETLFCEMTSPIVGKSVHWKDEEIKRKNVKTAVEEIKESQPKVIINFEQQQPLIMKSQKEEQQQSKQEPNLDKEKLVIENKKEEQQQILPKIEKIDFSMQVNLSLELQNDVIIKLQNKLKQYENIIERLSKEKLERMKIIEELTNEIDLMGHSFSQLYTQK